MPDLRPKTLLFSSPFSNILHNYKYVYIFLPGIYYFVYVTRSKNIGRTLSVNKLKILPFYVMSRPNDHCFV